MRRIYQYPLFLFLLPLSFAAHGLSVQYGRATVCDGLAVAGLVAVLLLALTALLRLPLRSWMAAALAAAVAGLIGLYWSYPYLRLKAAFGDSWAVRLPVVLAAAALVWLALAAALRRTVPAQRARLALFGNLLFWTLFLVDTATGLYRYGHAAAIPVGRIPPAIRSLYAPVFVVLFDEYGSPAALEAQGIGTGGVVPFLEGAGFRVVPHARAAYPITHFSMAAALNGSYLPLDASRPVTLRDYNDALVRIRRAQLVDFFQQARYKFRNRSVFRLGGTAPFEGHSPLVEGREVLLAGTLWETVLHPLWLKRYAPHRLEAHYFDGLRRNQALVQAVAADARERGPVFSYAHFFLPHAPFLYDGTGRPLLFAEALQRSAANDPAGYADNLQVATRLLKRCVTVIRQQRPDAIVLVLGDHGYRNDRLPGHDTTQFQPLCAVYYPDQQYAGWTDTTGLVNAFRLVTAKALRLRIPLLPERHTALHDATGLDW